MPENLDLPADWARGDDIDMTGALSLALEALDVPSSGRHGLYYTLSGNYAGASFATLGRNDPFDVAADDLHAVTMLSVTIGPHGTRQLLDEGEARARVLEALRAVPHDVSLASSSGADLLAAWKLHEEVLAAIRVGTAGKGPWVTASKLCARKRPYLIPVRDNVVGAGLGAAALARSSVYWQVIRALLKEASVIAAMREARTRMQADADRNHAPIKVDDSDLRFLDAALWMHLARGTSAGPPSDENL